MNQAQVTNIVQQGVILAAGILIKHGYTAAGHAINTTSVVSAIVALLVFWWSHRGNSIKALLAKADAITPSQVVSASTNSAGNRSLTSSLLLILLLPLLCLTGCTSVMNTPGGKIASITERGIGFHVKTTSTTTETPDVVFGFWSSALVFIPTSTNSPTFSPNFANTFDFGQSGVLSQSISENIASGSYQTLAPGQTNAVVTTQPIVAK